MPDNNQDFDVNALGTPQGVLNMLGKYLPNVMQGNKETSDLISSSMGALNSMKSADPEMALYAAMLRPTKSGSFGESLGNAGESYYGALNQAKNFDLEKMNKMIALQQAKQNLSMAPIDMLTKVTPFAQQAAMANQYTQVYGGGAGSGSGAGSSGSQPAPNTTGTPTAGASAPSGATGASSSAAPQLNQAQQAAIAASPELSQAWSENQRQLQIGTQRAMVYGDNKLLEQAQKDRAELLKLLPSTKFGEATATEAGRQSANPDLVTIVDPDSGSKSQVTKQQYLQLVEEARASGKQPPMTELSPEQHKRQEALGTSSVNPEMVTIIDPVSKRETQITKQQYVKMQQDAQASGGAMPITKLSAEELEKEKANIANDAALVKDFQGSAYKHGQDVSQDNAKLMKLAQIYKTYEPGRWAEDKAELIGKAVSLGLVDARSAAGMQQADFDAALKFSLDEALGKAAQNGASRAPATILNNVQKTVASPTIAPSAARDVIAYALANNEFKGKMYDSYDHDKKPNVLGHIQKFNRENDFTDYLNNAYSKLGTFKGMALPPPEDRTHGVQYPTPEGALYWDQSRSLWTNKKPPKIQE